MRLHSRVGLVTNSSSETFSFSGLGRSQEDINKDVETLWVEFCLSSENLQDLQEWWSDECYWTCGRKPEDRSNFSIEKVIQFGSPITFYIAHDGKAEHFTSMDNDTAVDKFARFVEERMNSNPVYSGTGVMRDLCDMCMCEGRNTCPPCRLR